MMSGFETAWGEITLVFFTSLAPSGVFALVLLVPYLVSQRLAVQDRQRLDQFLALPLLVSMVGLIASATHLGNPANALYVFLGVGRSPLSNEVFFAAIFLFLAGAYWLYAFSTRPKVLVQNIWLLLIGLAGIAFITAMAFAYNAETIISWNTLFVPLNLWLNALVGGPILALFTLQLSKTVKQKKHSYPKILCILSALATVASVISMALQSASLSDIKNSFLTAKELVPFYEPAIAIFAILSTGALCIYGFCLRKKRLPSFAGSLLACILVFLGIFLTRFIFYMMHMTAGLA